MVFFLITTVCFWRGLITFTWFTALPVDHPCPHWENPTPFLSFPRNHTQNFPLVKHVSPSLSPSHQKWYISVCCTCTYSVFPSRNLNKISNCGCCSEWWGLRALAHCSILWDQRSVPPPHGPWPTPQAPPAPCLLRCWSLQPSCSHPAAPQWQGREGLGLLQDTTGSSRTAQAPRKSCAYLALVVKPNLLWNLALLNVWPLAESFNALWVWAALTNKRDSLNGIVFQRALCSCITKNWWHRAAFNPNFSTSRKMIKYISAKYGINKIIQARQSS